MDIYLPTERWSELLLEATELPSQFSLSYGLDLRYLFIRNWVSSLEKIGFPVLREPIPKFIIKNAQIIDDPVAHNLATITAKRFAANPCFGYGLEDYSYKALNYSNRIVPLPRHFVMPGAPLSLGNVAIGIDAPPSGIHLRPPSELAIGYAAEVPLGKKRCIVAWLDVRFVRQHICSDLIEKIDAIDAVFMQAEPMVINFKNEQSPPQRYVQYYQSGPYVKVTEEKEQKIREAFGYPTKGKTGIREKMLYDSVCLIFGQNNVVRCYRGLELEGLELDVWVPDYKIAFEYQGEQHLKHIPHWHGEKGLEYQKIRDKKKQQLCKKLGYRLMLLTPKDCLDFVTILGELRRHWWI